MRARVLLVAVLVATLWPITGAALLVEPNVERVRLVFGSQPRDASSSTYCNDGPKDSAYWMMANRSTADDERSLPFVAGTGKWCAMQFHWFETRAGVVRGPVRLRGAIACGMSDVVSGFRVTLLVSAKIIDRWTLGEHSVPCGLGGGPIAWNETFELSEPLQVNATRTPYILVRPQDTTPGGDVRLHLGPATDRSHLEFGFHPEATRRTPTPATLSPTGIPGPGMAALLAGVAVGAGLLRRAPR